MRKISFILLLLLGLPFVSRGQINSEPALIRYPSEIIFEQGFFNLDGTTRIIVEDSDRFTDESSYLQHMIKELLGFNLPIVDDVVDNVIRLRYDGEQKQKEGYSLRISCKSLD